MELKVGQHLKLVDGPDVQRNPLHGVESSFTYRFYLRFYLPLNPLHGVERAHHRRAGRPPHGLNRIHYMELKGGGAARTYTIPRTLRIHYMELKEVQGARRSLRLHRRASGIHYMELKATCVPACLVTWSSGESITWS